MLLAYKLMWVINAIVTLVYLYLLIGVLGLKEEQKVSTYDTFKWVSGLLIILFLLFFSMYLKNKGRTGSAVLLLSPICVGITCALLFCIYLLTGRNKLQ
ncbi:hypothetical protein ACFQ1J_15250 [Pedobacter boryungensis]